MGSLGALIAMYINIWQKTTKDQRKKKRQESTTSVIEPDVITQKP